MSTPLGSSQFFLNAAQEGGQSLRFEDGDSAYLSWTPASNGNRQIWTFSCWFKRGNIGSSTTIPTLFCVNDSATGLYNTVNIQSDDTMYLQVTDGSSAYYKQTSRVFRDTSAWYHLVWSVDTTQATAADRVKVYINGVEETNFSTSQNPTQNANTDVNSTQEHNIGKFNDYSRYWDGYLANVTLIDGQQLDPTSFGEYSDTLWKPKSDTDIQSLTFGTNGFYLPFKQTTEAEGFSTVTYTGNGGTQGIEGVGFEPDLVWIKGRDFNSSNWLTDSVRGNTKILSSNGTGAEATLSNCVTSFDSTGFSVGSNTDFNSNGKKFVAWCWDAGSGSAASNTDGSITSSVKANTAKGFSITSYVGNGTAGATVGHGLSSAPDMVIVKIRSGFSGGTNWRVYHSALGATKNIILNSTGAAVSETNKWNDTAPTSSVFSLGNHVSVNENNATAIAYCFHSVSGYSSIGSYTANTTTPPVITGLGFKPAFLMVKNISRAEDWAIIDNTRDVGAPKTKLLVPNSSSAEIDSVDRVTFDSDGFTVNAPAFYTFNYQTGDTYIYMAFADTRDATFFGDTSGNSNNWTPNALNNTDVVPDSPVTGGNFAVLSAVDRKSGGTLSEGNLGYNHNSNTYPIRSTFAVDSGKWYWEVRASGNGSEQGLALEAGDLYGTYATYNLARISFYNGNKRIGSGSLTSYDTGGAATAGDVYGFAADLDNGDLTVYRNGTSLGSLHTWTPDGTYYTPHMDYSTTSSGVDIANFGQDSSFAGNATPQGNTDDNGVGDFYYTPPSGFLALTTGNLDAPTITAPDEYFNTVLYTGTGTTDQSVTGVGFQPDFTWIKSRSNTYYHWLSDAVRGAGKALVSNTTDDEYTTLPIFLSFDSDGFTVDVDTATANNTTNGSGATFVAWNWLAGNGTVSNTSGSITSTVSANQTAGFSVATYTGNGTGGATIGHGLSSAPEMVIVKRRDAADDWSCFHASLGGTKYIDLNSTNAAGTSIVVWNNTAPSSTVVTLGTSNRINGSGATYVAYSFAEVKSYSKIGSYTGNGSSDGTFVHCGFRPAWILVKRTDAVENWEIWDKERGTYNLNTPLIYANLSNVETGNASRFDVLSNGFKTRTTNTGVNASGGTYIFLAFAEAPFKLANAR